MTTLRLGGGPSDPTLRRLELVLGSERRAAWIPAVWVVLFFVSNIRFTGSRDLSLAATGVASPENLMELAVYAIVGALALMLLLVVRTRPRSLGIALLATLGVLAVSSSLWSRVPIFSFVRGGQLVVVGVLTAATAAAWSGGRRNLESDWRSIWVGFVAVTGLATAVSLALGVSVGGRFTWPGHHPGVTAGIIAVATLACLSMLLEPGWRITGRLKRLLPLLVAAGVIALGLTVSRTAILGLTASIVVLFVSASRSRFDLRMLGISTLILVAGSTVAAFSEQVLRFVARGANLSELATITGRTELWAYALTVLGQSPIGGFGYGAGRLVLSEEIPWAGTGHNLWVEAGISLGLMGLVCVTALLAWSLVASTLLQRRAPGPVGNLSLALLVFEAIAAVTGSSFALPGTGLALVGLLIAAVTAESSPRWLSRSGTGGARADA